MALKALMLRREIEQKKAELEALSNKDAEFVTREAELEAAIAETETDDQRNTVAAEVEAFETEKATHEDAKAELTTKIENLENELAKEERKAPKPKVPETQKTSERSISAMTINIRSLPMSKYAFEALELDTRNAILAKDDVKNFLNELRSMKGQTRAISGGELTIPVVFLDLIAENTYRYSKLLNHIRVRNVGGEARQTIAGTIPEAIWTEMCGIINEMSLMFGQVTTDGYKVAGFVPVCNSLLEDSDMNLASYIVEAISEAIGLAIDKAILYGKGAASKMPLGIVTRLAQTSQPADYPANAPAWEDLHTKNIKVINGDSMTGAEFWAALTLAAGETFTKYSRGEMFWAMNSKTHNYLKSKLITFTANGDIAANLYAVLPIVTGNVVILEFMPTYDIVGGYGDLYLWTQRAGMTIEASREVQFIQDNTVFKGKERADGTPVIAGAFVAINVKNTSVTTAMLFAADTANTLSGILLPTSAEVQKNGTLQLAPVLTPFGIKGTVSYSSATTAKATISSTGLVTGVATGSSVITATCGDFSATCTVTVVE